MVLCCTFKASVVSPWFLVTVRNHTCNCAQDLEHFFLLREEGATLHTLLTKAGTPVYLTYDRAAIFLEVYISLEWSQSLCPMF